MTQRQTKADAPLIAERTFFLDGDPDQKPVLTFRLWRPYDPKDDYPRCAYELVGAEYTRSGEISGVDKMDCIVACLGQIGSTVAILNESVFGGRLRWLASPEGGPGLGLPTIEGHWPFRDLCNAAEEWSQEWARRQQDSGSESAEVDQRRDNDATTNEG